MRVKFLFAITALLLFSCLSSRMDLSQKTCKFKIGFVSYEKITDSTFLIKLQKLGTNYFNFSIDSCSTFSANNFRFIGNITYPDATAENFQRKISDAKIIKVIQIDNKIFKSEANLGKSDKDGKFDLEVKTDQKELFFLINKEGYNPTLVQIEWK